MWFAGVLAVCGVAQDRSAPPGFQRVLYVNGGPPADAAGFAGFRELGFDAISLHRSADPAGPGAHGLRFYQDQIVGKGVLELRDRQWRPLHEAYERDRGDAGLVRPGCMSREDVRSELLERVDRRLETLGEHRPFAICLADEPSTTRHVNPLDFCLDPACVERYQDHLTRRYGSVEVLNAAWGTEYGSFREVEIWTADRVRARELHAGELPRNLTPWGDHLEFREVVFADLAQALLRRVHEGAPDTPAGMTGMQAPSAYGGYDYRRLMPGQGFYETYDIGGARQIARCFADRGALEFATLFPPGQGQSSRWVEAQLYDMIAHGMAGVIVWSSGLAFDGAVAPTEFGRSLQRAFRATRRAAEVFAGARILRAPIWILESQASVRAHWMLDSAGDGKTWVRRLSSYERTHSTSMAARESWLQVFHDLGYQPRIVSGRQLSAALRRAPPRLLVLPASIALSDDEVAAIRDYVIGGGHVVADHATARYDERLRLRDAPALDELFGLRRTGRHDLALRVSQGRGPDKPRTTSGLAVAEPGIACDVSEPVGDGGVVHCEAEHERGRATYLNLAVCEYGRWRLDPDRATESREMRARVRRVLAEARVEPPVIARGRGLPTCLETVLLLGRERQRLLALRLNALSSPELMRVLDERGPREVVIEFPAPQRVRDLGTGEDLGTARRFTRTLDPFGAVLLQFEDDR